MSDLICLPENDEDKRYILRKLGDKNLMAIGFNPSTADTNKHDPTSANIEKIAKHNGYDGWTIANISAQRTSNPVELSLTENKSYLDDNRYLIYNYIDHKPNKINDVLVAWGDIGNMMHPAYIRNYAYYILDSLQTRDLNFWCIKLTKDGHPFHPSPSSINCHIGKVEDIVLHPFNVKSYLKMLRLKFKIK